MNLVINARHAMPDGGKLTIKAANAVIDENSTRTSLESRPGSFICLTVADTGHGMKKEIVKHMFEPFFTTKPKGKGTGLGLAVVYGIVKQHNGWVTVDSRPGQGTAFKIYLPAIAPAQAGRPAIDPINDLAEGAADE